MADLELSCGLPPGPEFADLVVLAEELGYARAWIYDSAPLWEDPFVHLALASVRTTRIGRRLARLADAGFAEIIYTPTGPDVARELRAFASAHQPQLAE